MTWLTQNDLPPTAGAPLSEKVSAPRGHLVVLDDEGMFCEFVSHIGDACGYDVFGTTQPDQLFDYLDRHSVSVIVLDLRMPGVDGLDVLRQFAKMGVSANILIASGADGRVMETAMRLGRAQGLKMAGTIHKPIDAGALRALLEHQVRIDEPLSPERLRGAIDADELVLYYQPIVDLRSGAVSGVEALMRWQHPDLGLVMPSMFIPMAERAGMVGLLTDWALGEAVRQAGVWQRAGLTLKIAVNISIANAPDEGLPDRLEWMCDNEGIPPSAISLELTESSTMRDPVRLMELFTRFRLKGFDLSIDDFGTGYSSLVHLQRLPFSALKIDQVFVSSMLESDSGASIVLAVISLARALGLKCIAEGVESQEMLDFLRANGCDFVQGYHMAQPMPAAEIPVFLAA